MLNQVVLVGRIKEIKGDRDNIEILIRVPRSFKNEEEIYDEDIINCIVRGTMAEETKKYCGQGDVIGIKGRLAKLENDKELSLVAEKVTFLSSKKNN